MAKAGPRKTNRYSEEFKATAVRLSDLPDVLIQDVAEALDIHPFMLSRWRKQAREKGVPVVYSLAGQSLADILPEVAPDADEASVSSGPDKFMNTELDKILKGKDIRTVIVVGTSAEGAVLNTASGAALRGLKVIIPVDGMSSNTPYAEQYTTWHLANAPRIGVQTTLTRFDMIGF